MKNSAFPGHIRNGLTVVGMNAELPNGFKAEAATYMAPGCPGSSPAPPEDPAQGRQRPGQSRLVATGGGNGSGEMA